MPGILKRMEIIELVPKFVYFPKPSKTILIVKNPSQLEFANDIFTNTGVKITIEEEQHLGAGEWK